MKLNTPDVPVFTAAYQRSQTQVDIALRAGPGSGQTPGFAHRAVLHEDPALMRNVQTSDVLLEHLLHRDEYAIVTALPHKSRSTNHTCVSDAVVIAPPNWRPSPPLTTWEQSKQKFARLFKQTRLVKLSIKIYPREGVALVYDCLAILGRKIASGIQSIKTFRWIPDSAPHRRLYRDDILINFPNIKLPKISRPALAYAGQAMLVGSLVLFLLTIAPILRLQAGEWWEQSRVAVTGKAAEPAVRETLMDAVRKPEEVPPEEKQFQLVIPKLNASLKVIPNVDAGDEKAYAEALKRGVAHAIGSGLPGEANTTNRTIYIFGHSTNAVWNIAKYNALFYSLKDMVVGDEIIVWFWGKEFHYQVSSVVKIDPSDLTYLQPQVTKDQLILQTCWPPGTVWKRLLVIATPVAK